MQGVGVFILLFILNQNMATLKGHSLPSEVKQWLSEYSRIGKPVEVKLTGEVADTATGTVSLSIQRQADTTEGKIRILEEEIKIIKREATDNRNALEEKISANKTDINSVDAKINDLAKKLINAVIGDFRWPVFSILIILAGLFISFPPLLIPHERSPER